MAVPYFAVKVGKAGKATPHAEYISREGKYAQRLQQGEKLEATASGNMPKWAADKPLEFWKSADLYERKNGSVYREHEIALPRELTPAQRVALVKEWVSQELGDRHAYTWAIHNKTALDGGEQPHVHLMFSERTNDGIERDPEQYFKRYNGKYPERGGAKKHRSGETPTERKEALKAMRERWESLHNAHLAQHGHQSAAISMKSLAAQGIDRKAEPKRLPSVHNALLRKANADRAARQAVADIKADRVVKIRDGGGGEFQS
ncbi:MAG: MobA/MobL family protein [Brachymonas sp.]|nr:MobA/MobL family protein [Brachymonas sp.]